MTSGDGGLTGLFQSAADLLTVTTRILEGDRGGPLTTAAEMLDRAIREPRNVRSDHRSRLASHLRAMSRLIASVRRLPAQDEEAAALQLVLHISMIAEHVAEPWRLRLREGQQRLHQARAARQAADQLRRAVTDRAAIPRVAHPTATLVDFCRRRPHERPARTRTG